MKQKSKTPFQSVSFGILIITSLSVGILDQLSKAYVSAHLILNQVIATSIPWISLARKPNSGIIGEKFSFIEPGVTEWIVRYIPTSLALLFIVTTYLTRRFGKSKLEALGLGMILGGIVSNLWDHWNSYVVIDSLVLRGSNEILSFNLADLSLTLGLVLTASKQITEVINFSRSLPSESPAASVHKGLA